MNILLLGNASSVHIIKWANSISELKGYNVFLVSQDEFSLELNDVVNKIKLRFSGNKGYFLNAIDFNSIVKKINPDVINVHYASGYGTLASFLINRKYLINVWGADVYDVPHQSMLMKFLVKRALHKAEMIASTSNCMANETKKLMDNPSYIYITPFGVDIDKFKALSPIDKEKETMVIGTVKTLHHKYGIDNLIKAFSRLPEYIDGKRVILKIAGVGPQLNILKDLSTSLNILDRVDFLAAERS